MSLVLGLTMAAGGCELVLGDLPKARPNGAGGDSASSSAGGGGASASSSSGRGGHGEGGGGATSVSSSSSSVASSTTGSESSSSGGCCDCDGDGHRAMGPCGGDDCDDHDPLVYPEEDIYYAAASKNPAVGFDYDCSGVADRNPKLDVVVNCNSLALPCPSTIGFLGTVAPACGKPGDWGTCKPNGLVCANDVIEKDKVMTCK